MRQRRLDYSKSVEERNLHLSLNCGQWKVGSIVHPPDTYTYMGMRVTHE